MMKKKRINNTHIFGFVGGVIGVGVGLFFGLEPYEWWGWGGMIGLIQLVSIGNIIYNWNK